MLTWFSKHVFFPLWEVKNGAHRRRYLRELSASQWLATDLLYQQQWRQVHEAVAYAFMYCPYYQDRFANISFDGTLRDWKDFQRLPLLTKQDIRKNGDGLLSREFRREDLVETKTGGSTGVALKLY